MRFRQETINAIDPATRRVTTDAGSYDADILVVALGADYDMDAESGYISVNPKTLATSFPDVYAFGDCAKQGTPKAGNFAEGAANAVATTLIASLRSGVTPVPHAGTGTCYIEFGAGRIGRVDGDFFARRSHRHVLPAVAGIASRQGIVRIDPSCPVVRPLTQDQLSGPAGAL